MTDTAISAARLGWGALLSGKNAVYSLALAGSVVLHAVNLYIATTILPSAVRRSAASTTTPGARRCSWSPSILGSALSAQAAAGAGARGAYVTASAAVRGRHRWSARWRRRCRCCWPGASSRASAAACSMRSAYAGDPAGVPGGALVARHRPDLGDVGHRDAGRAGDRRHLCPDRRLAGGVLVAACRWRAVGAMALRAAPSGGAGGGRPAGRRSRSSCCSPPPCWCCRPAASRTRRRCGTSRRSGARWCCSGSWSRPRGERPSARRLPRRRAVPGQRRSARSTPPSRC